MIFIFFMANLWLNFYEKMSVRLYVKFEENEKATARISLYDSMRFYLEVIYH